MKDSFDFDPDYPTIHQSMESTPSLNLSLDVLSRIDISSATTDSRAPSGVEWTVEVERPLILVVVSIEMSIRFHARDEVLAARGFSTERLVQPRPWPQSRVEVHPRAQRLVSFGPGPRSNGSFEWGF